MTEVLTHETKRLAELKSAARLIETCEYIDKSPLELIEQINGINLYGKYESDQPAGSFKGRGAWVKMNQLAESGANAVTGASAGNHAIGMAMAARTLNLPATVYLPETITNQRLDRITNAGRDSSGTEWASVVRMGQTMSQALDYARASDASMIEPFNDLSVIAGQATVAREILTESGGQVDRIFTTCGGGGLAAGTLETLESSPNTRLTIVELEGNDSASRSVSAGKLMPASSVNRLAAGAAVEEIGQLPLDIMLRYRHRLDFVTITEAQLGAAIIRETDRSRYSAGHSFPEATGLIALAGAYRLANSQPASTRDANWTAIISGSNIDQAAENTLRQSYLKQVRYRKLTSVALSSSQNQVL